MTEPKRPVQLSLFYGDDCTIIDLASEPYIESGSALLTGVDADNVTHIINLSLYDRIEVALLEVPDDMGDGERGRVFSIVKDTTH